MTTFVNISNHYWIIGGSETAVYSSKTNTMVAPDDADYTEWRTAYGSASNIASEAELAVVLRNRGTSLPDWLLASPSFVQPAPGEYSNEQLKAYNDDARWRKEQSGITLSTGMPIETNDRAQAKISGAMLAAKYPPTPTKAQPGGGGPAFTTKWHAADGTFWPLDTPGIVAMSGELQLYIDECFEASSAVSDAIDAGTITTLQQIDAAYGL